MTTSPVKRRLVTILAADAVAYSRLMSEDEEGTLRVLAAHRAVIDGIVAFHDGRIVNTAGDSVIAEFESPVQAVRCAVEIQDALKTRNDTLPESQRLLFRIGINLGDVMVKGDDLLGDGVNVAARLEGIAEPGGVCISSSVHDQISGKLDLQLQDIGEQNLKNISRPIRTFRIRTAPPPSTPPGRRPRRLAWGGGLLAAAGLLAFVLWRLGLPLSTAPADVAGQPASPPVVHEATGVAANVANDSARSEQAAEVARAAAKAEADVIREAAIAVGAAEKERAHAEARRIRAEAERDAARLRAKSAERASRPAAEKQSTPLSPPTLPAPAPYDGDWQLKLDCPAWEKSGPRRESLPVHIAASSIVVEHGVDGQPASFRMQGQVAPDGKLSLEGHGYPGKRLFRGKPFLILIAGSFTGGQFEAEGKFGGRHCQVALSR